MKTDIQLQSPSIAECQALISAGWRIGWAGTGHNLDVWMVNPANPKDILGIDPAHFAKLRAFERDVREEAKATAADRMEHIKTPSSSAIFSFGYDPASQVFEIRYKSSPTTTYSRHNVPAEIFEQAQKAESIGSFIGKTFNRGNLDKFPETKREDAICTGPAPKPATVEAHDA